MICYPIPLYKQEAFLSYVKGGFKLENTETLCNRVLSTDAYRVRGINKHQYII